MMGMEMRIVMMVMRMVVSRGDGRDDGKQNECWLKAFASCHKHLKSNTCVIVNTLLRSSLSLLHCP